MIVYFLDGFAHKCRQCGSCCQEYPSHFGSDEISRTYDIFNALDSLPPGEKPNGPYTNIIVFNKDAANNKITYTDGDSMIKEKNAAILQLIEKGEAIVCFNLINGNCVFLEEDKKCFLHSKFGCGIKINTCKQYPFKVLLTPGGVFHRLLFECPANLMALRFPFKIAAQKVEGDQPQINDAVKFYQDIQVPWKTLLAIESALDSTIANPMNSIRGALFGCHELLKLLYHDIETNAEESITVKIARLLPLVKNECAKPAPAIDDRIKGFSALLSIIDDFRRGIVLSSFVDMTGAFPRLMNDLRVALRLDDDFKLTDESKKILAENLERMDFETDSLFIAELRNYFRLKIFDKMLFMEFGVVPAFYFICFLYAAIRLFSITVLKTNKTSDTDSASTLSAIQYVEKYFLRFRITLNGILSDKAAPCDDRFAEIAELLF